MRWNNYVKELSNLFFFWFFGVVFFFLFRVSFISIFHKELGSEVGITDYLKTFWMGFRFDCMILGYFLLLPFLLLLSFSRFKKIQVITQSRRVTQYLFLILSSIICVVSLNFYKEYNTLFNNFIFLGLYDDQAAIWKTIIDYYHPVWNSLAIIAIFIISFLILRYFENKTTIYNSLIKLQSNWSRGVLVVLTLLLFAGSIRGSFTGTVVSRKWAAVSKDFFLNKTIINPYRSLMYAYKDFNTENPFGEQNIQVVFQKDSVSQVLEKSAEGSEIERPKQVFLIIMESYDSWPLMDKYMPLGISTCLSEIAEKSVHFTNFLPAYNASIHAYNTIITGIPYCGVQTNHISSGNTPYITSVFHQFKRLGYKTNFFYGGFLSWQKIGDFTRSQGCDQIYAAGDIGGSEESGNWGIEDGTLFDFVLQQVDPNEYTFNVIFTTSYHAPFAIDVYKKGFPYKSADDLPEEMRAYYDTGMTLQEMGHLWYSDYEIGRFMQQATEKFEHGLYGFTGDHYGRRFLNYQPNPYEKSSVPFIVYGKGIAPEKKNTPGDHADIIPTLIELVAPKGFTYYSFGSSLLDNNKTYGLAFEKAISQNSLYHFPKDAPVERFSMEDKSIRIEPNHGYEDEYQKRITLAWHYLMRGNSLIR